MQTANVIVAIGGDRDQCVPKEVTAAEVAVLRAVHGDDAVFDIVIGPDKDVGNREELERLRRIYASTGPDSPAGRRFQSVYPGAAARVFDNFVDMDLDPVFYKNGRAPTRQAAAPAKRGRKVAEPTPVDPVEDAEDDGIEDMADNVMG